MELELFTNALKYAFPLERATLSGQTTSERAREINIALHTTDDGEIELCVRDNGIGLPEDFDVSKATSLGLQLVRMFAEHQLGGTVEWHNENGAVWRIVFRERNTEKSL